MDGFLVEAKRIRGFSRSFRAHFHEEYSVALVREGCSRAVFPSGDRTVAAGSLVLIPPGVPHACNPDTAGAWSYLLLLADPRWVAGLSGDPTVRAALLSGEGRILRAPAEAPEVLEEAAGSAGLAEGVRAEAEEALRALLLAVAECVPARAPDRTAGTPDPRARRVERRLRERLDGPVALKELADLAGVGERAVLRLFRSAYGLSPYAYRTNLRINEAKRLLRSGLDIAQAALASGFYDQSHLHRRFVRRVGLTPADWAERARDPVGFVQDPIPHGR